MGRKKAPVSDAATAPRDRTQPGKTTKSFQKFRLSTWGHGLTGAWVLMAAATTALNLGIVDLLERQVQALFFEVRGAIAAPPEVVILAIDETSLAQQEFYQTDPDKYSYLEPIQSWPWQRSAYAQVIDKLMAAGARSVSLDIIFSAPSSYGEVDDQQFAQSLQQHAERVVLAAQYNDVETPQGFTTQLTSPLALFQHHPNQAGSINFFMEPDGKIHRFGNQFLVELIQNSPANEVEAYRELAATTPTFVDATLRAAQVEYPTPRGKHIFFYGPSQTFEHIPFWYVLDPTTWETTLQSGEYFKDKIVLIGATAAVHQDFHAAPFSKSWLYSEPMAGVEIHANAIASLLQGRSLAEALPQAPLRGLVLLIGLAGAGLLLSRPRQPAMRWVWAMGMTIAWGGISYIAFTYGQLILPTAIPVGAITLSGFSQLMAGSVKEQQRKQHLRDTLKQYATSPIVQEIISQQDDLQDLIQEREQALSGKVLHDRYKIVKVLGSGGFSETYIAEDMKRSGSAPCVVKQLRIASDNLDTLKLARRLFATEAETLERLGQHDQIPSFLNSFEEDQEFYLVQEFVAGQPLSNEFNSRVPLPESKVVVILQDLLRVLEFVHSQGVIHRDLKPSNIIRRKSDNRLVLIDFGIAKRITTQLADVERNTKFTVAVGTPGYMPNEQSAGRPHFNSDIYALGMIAIEALTGQPPHMLNHDGMTGEVIWRKQAPQVSSECADVLTKMVRYDFTQRYTSVRQVHEALKQLPIVLNSVVATAQLEEGSTAIFEQADTAMLTQEDTAVFEQADTAIFEQADITVSPEDSKQGSLEDLTKVKAEDTAPLPEN
ncbi:CHASE2 domain-containing protein [Leptolyngbya sp. FACHB-541]|uniref:serine/threonine-protein kinase n=1 Tax=Leptolyngbya sp. FACHB-541 TaxID=2692810 RepID=UPI001683C484|nr:serine/threonine-protein kinase [Leptolyngbya sp. FACHB-541]MBD1998390.1 CHASE2 domain-containing protein [Leptolyngbya sp. FACHB-541]